MGISIPVIVGVGSLLGILPFLKFKGFNFKRGGKNPKEYKPKESFNSPPVILDPSPVVEAVSSAVVTSNKIKLAVVTALCGLLFAVIKVNENDC